MAQYYSTAYLSDPFRPTTSLHLEPVNTAARVAGQIARQYFSIVLPVGLSSSTTDFVNLTDFQDSTFTGGMIIRPTRLYLNNTANVGGTTTANIGFKTSAPSVYAASSTLLQSAGVLDVAIATLFANPLAVADTLGLTINSTGPSTTASTLSGFIEWSFNRP